jgi:hypothetical protein
MRIIINGKRLQTGLLLCSLLLLQYFNYGIFSSVPLSSSRVNGFDTACSSGVGQHSSMGEKVYAGLNYIETIIDTTRLNIASSEKSRGHGFKNNHSFLGLVSAAQAASLISHLNLSILITTQFDSLQITTFLHKKDGMK